MGNSQATKKEVEYLQELSSKAQNSNLTLPEEEVQKLVESLGSSRPRVQEWAANTISWLTKDNGDNRKSFGRQGCLRPLVQRLKSRDIKVQCWSVCAVGNLCIDSDDNKKELIELKGVDYILRLLKSSDETVNRWACNAVGILCMDNEEAVQMVSKGGGVSLLVSCLHSSNFRVNRWAAFALGNLLGPEENRHLVVKKGGFDPLVRILDSPKKDNEAKRWVANVIGLLCMKDPLARVEAGKAGAVEPLVVLLRDSRDMSVLRNVAFAIANVCLDNNANKAKVKMLGGLRMLLNILQAKRNVDFKLQMAAGSALLNICDGDDELPDKVKDVLAKAKGTARPEREIRKLVDLVDGSQTVAMRLVKKAPAITDLFTNMDAPPSPSPKGNPLSGRGGPSRITRDGGHFSSEGSGPLLTPRRLALVSGEESDKRRRTSSLPPKGDELEPKGQLGRVLGADKRKRSVSANALPQGPAPTQGSGSPRRGLERPLHLNVAPAPRVRRGSIGSAAEAPESRDVSLELEVPRRPTARRLTLAGDEGPPPMMPMPQTTTTMMTNSPRSRSKLVPMLTVQTAADRPLDEDDSSEDADEGPAPSFWEMLEGDVKFDELQIQEEIGVGAFGTIYAALYHDQRVAVKEFTFSEDEHVQRLAVREVGALRLLEHRNIVRYLGLCVHLTGAYLVTELIDGGDLREVLKREKKLPWPIRLSVANDIASALAYVHAKGLMHRDVKSKNVLLRSGDHSALLCDFGFARETDPTSPLASVPSATPGTMTLKVGTSLWMAPEVLAGGAYGQPADVYSFGILLVELITCDKPPGNLSLYAQPEALRAFLLEHLAAASSTTGGSLPFEATKLVELAVRCVSLDADKRPTMADLQTSLV